MARLSPQMIRMLDDVASGFGTHGTALHKGEHGGRYRTAQALRRLGLLNLNNEITADGRRVINFNLKSTK